MASQAGRTCLGSACTASTGWRHAGWAEDMSRCLSRNCVAAATHRQEVWHLRRLARRLYDGSCMAMVQDSLAPFISRSWRGAHLENLQALESTFELFVIVLEVVLESRVQHHLSKPHITILIYNAVPSSAVSQNTYLRDLHTVDQCHQPPYRESKCGVELSTFSIATTPLWKASKTRRYIAPLCSCGTTRVLMRKCTRPALRRVKMLCCAPGSGNESQAQAAQ